MARTRTRRLRWMGGLTAVACSAALSAVTLPAHAAQEGQILGAGEPGSVCRSYLLTLKDFGGRARYGCDFVGNDRTASDGNGHGTHVAGTIAGTKYGVAKQAKVVAVRVLDNAGFFFQAEDGIRDLTVTGVQTCALPI